MIEIQGIYEQALDDIVKLLLKEEQPFEIYVPKSTQLFASSSDDIAIDYAMLAFAGQQLSEVADEFSYNYISPENHDSVLFEIKTNNIDTLAEVILHISHGYNNESDEIYYTDEVYGFLEQVETGVIVPICTEFVDNYREYRQLAE